MHDAGGNANYRVNMHGYDWKQNLVYDTPTTHRDVVVAGNRVHGAKQFFHDGGAIYNLSASPGTLITENYIFDNSRMIALYLDEGSRYLTVRKNVVEDKEGVWLNINTAKSAYPLRISPDNTASGNWHDGTKVGGMWTNYQNDLILDDHWVANGQLARRSTSHHAECRDRAFRRSGGRSGGRACGRRIRRSICGPLSTSPGRLRCFRRLNQPRGVTSLAVSPSF